MSALDDILKRSEFPAVRKCYQDFHAFGKQSVPWSAFDAIEELATKLAKSIEWGRIERKRKEKAETEREELRIMRDNDILSRDRTIEDLRRRAEQAKWKALADERWELAACHLDGCRRRDEELEALSDRLDERDAQLAALEDEVERADAEIKRLNDICDRLAAAGRSHD